MSGQEPPKGANLITLREASRRSGIPYWSLKNAMYGKHRKLDAVLVEVTPDIKIWHTWPEALSAYQAQHKPKKRENQSPAKDKA